MAGAFTLLGCFTNCRIDCKRAFNFEHIASFVFAAAGLCLQLIAFVNPKSKEGHLLRIFSASRGLIAYYILMYPMSMCV
jgi:hypothetical protein